VAQIFNRNANKWPIYLAVIVVGLLVGTTFFFYYYGSPKYTDVGYQPVQPVEYSHKLHAGDLGIDCRYCHSNVEVSAKANVPATEICMNCHIIIGHDKKTLDPVRESWTSGKSIEWIRVHDLPDYVFFDHSAHLTAGVGCESCHGNVAAEKRVTQKKELSMSWCLTCHRNPEMNLRPHDEITTMGWEPPNNQMAFAHKVMQEKKINPPTDCSGCHR